MGRRRNAGGRARELPSAVVAHACAGRLRLSFPDRKEQRPFFEEICEAVLQLPGVTKVEGRPATGSLIITHEGAHVQLIEAARERGVFGAQEPASSSAAHAKETTDWQSLVETLLKDMSTPSGAARSAAIVALIGMAVLQASRGQIMPPSTTALWYALSLLLGAGAPSGEGSGDGAGSE